jgi:hypothetical protein
MEEARRVAIIGAELDLGAGSTVSERARHAESRPILEAMGATTRSSRRSRNCGAACVAKRLTLALGRVISRASTARPGRRDQRDESSARATRLFGFSLRQPLDGFRPEEVWR